MVEIETEEVDNTFYEKIIQILEILTEFENTSTVIGALTIAIDYVALCSVDQDGNPADINEFSETIARLCVEPQNIQFAQSLIKAVEENAAG